ncbi:MAG: hypothetical protein JWP45_2176 [Mucilaginibacter sp.]|nr:hypothetical protein [Mucilaginibacter sp.]
MAQLALRLQLCTLRRGFEIKLKKCKAISPALHLLINYINNPDSAWLGN